MKSEVPRVNGDVAPGSPEPTPERQQLLNLSKAEHHG